VYLSQGCYSRQSTQSTRLSVHYSRPNDSIHHESCEFHVTLDSYVPTTYQRTSQSISSDPPVGFQWVISFVESTAQPSLTVGFFVVLPVTFPRKGEQLVSSRPLSKR